MLPAAITNIHQAFKEIKHMAIDTWQEEYRLAARRAIKDLIEHRMHNAVDGFLEQIRAAGLPDRRNGSFSSHLVTEVGDLELRIPRTRTFSARSILQGFARRTASLERTILMCFLLGLSTRKVGPALSSILGEPVSPYFTDEGLHQITTLTRGKRVATSNHNGTRYAVLLSQPPTLPRNIDVPAGLERDIFYLGAGRRSDIRLSAERLLNVLVGGASRSGKSNFELGLAYTALQNGYALYLADPQEITFSPAWGSVTAAPVAASKAQNMPLFWPAPTRLPPSLSPAPPPKSIGPCAKS